MQNANIFSKSEKHINTVCSDLDIKSLFCCTHISYYELNNLKNVKSPVKCNDIFVILMINGNAFLELNNKIFHLEDGNVAIIMPDMTYSYYCETNCRQTYYVIRIADNFANKLFDRIISDNGFCFKHQNLQFLVDLAEKIILSYQMSSNMHTVEISTLISDFIHSLSQRAKKNIKSSKSSIIFEKAVKIIEENYSLNLTVDKISSALFISAPHFIRVFKKYCGMTPHRYLEKYRFLQARHLLSNTDTSIKDIAKLTGHKDISNFIEYFKKERGVTPGEYRKNIDKYEKRKDIISSYYTRDNKPAITKYKIY